MNLNVLKKIELAGTVLSAAGTLIGLVVGPKVANMEMKEEVAKLAKKMLDNK